MKRSTIDVRGFAIVNHEEVTSLMREFGAFSSGKVAVMMVDFHYELEFDKVQLDIGYFKNKMPVFADMPKKEFGDKLIFSYLHQVEHGDIVVKNTTELPFFNSEISVISYGGEEGFFVDIARASCPGIVVEEGEAGKIRSLSWNKEDER